MENGNDFRSRVLTHLQSEILDPFVLDHWFRTELERHSEKGVYDILGGMREVHYSQGVGFWFMYGVDPITICIEMGY